MHHCLDNAEGSYKIIYTDHVLFLIQLKHQFKHMLFLDEVMAYKQKSE